MCTDGRAPRDGATGDEAYPCLRHGPWIDAGVRLHILREAPLGPSLGLSVLQPRATPDDGSTARTLRAPAPQPEGPLPQRPWRARPATGGHTPPPRFGSGADRGAALAACERVRILAPSRARHAVPEAPQDAPRGCQVAPGRPRGMAHGSSCGEARGGGRVRTPPAGRSHAAGRHATPGWTTPALACICDGSLLAVSVPAPQSGRLAPSKPPSCRRGSRGTVRPRLPGVCRGWPSA